jgi:hypothetical protein
MQQGRHTSNLNLDSGVHDSHELNWLEFWPESEFKLDQAPAAAGHDPHAGGIEGLFPGMLHQSHKGAGLQHPGAPQDPYSGAASAQQATDRPSQYQVRLRCLVSDTCRLGLKLASLIRSFSS